MDIFSEFFRWKTFIFPGAMRFFHSSNFRREMGNDET